jgi:hypothetical protein
MATILSVGVAVCREGLSAGRADKFIVCLAVDQIEVRVPPGIAAPIRTELPGLPARRLYDGSATAFAGRSSFSGGSGDGGAAESVPLAVSLDGVLAYPRKLADLLVAASVFAVFRNGSPLFIRHFSTSEIRGRRPIIVISFAFLVPEREKRAVFPKKSRRNFQMCFRA